MFNLQICDATNNRNMGDVALGDGYESADLPALAMTADATYALLDHFAEGNRYELRVWKDDDIVASDTYTYTNGRLVK
ncbi:hypothetical protein [Streptomyces sp. 039-1]|uniref:hypothetical protein n=1 Tax=Streptomyces sp. 039-1 TaxID=2789263 RepID=UPI0039F513B4